MLKLFSALVFMYGAMVTALPWMLKPAGTIDMIISGIGVLIIGSALVMWHKAGSETR